MPVQPKSGRRLRLSKIPGCHPAKRQSGGEAWRGLRPFPTRGTIDHAILRHHSAININLQMRTSHNQIVIPQRLLHVARYWFSTCLRRGNSLSSFLFARCKSFTLQNLLNVIVSRVTGDWKCANTVEHLWNTSSSQGRDDGSNRYILYQSVWSLSIVRGIFNMVHRPLKHGSVRGLGWSVGVKDPYGPA
jgi:hypothetical protein